MRSLPTTQALGVKGAKNFLKGCTLRPLPSEARATVMRLYGISSTTVDSLLSEEAAKKSARRAKPKPAPQKRTTRTVVKKKSWFDSIFGGKR